MNNMLPLLKVHFLNIFGLNRAIHTKDKRERRKFIGFTIMMVIVFLMMAAIFLAYNFILAHSLKQAGAMRAFLPLMMSVTSLVILVTSIFKGSGTLFGFKDYDTVMSLPISVRTVVASRILMLYSMNVLFTLVIMVPAGIVYGLMLSPTAAFYPIFFITLLCIPLIPIIISTILSSLVSIVSARFRRTSVVSLILAVLLVVGVMLISFNAEMVIDNLAGISTVILNAVYGIYPLAPMYAKAISDTDMLSFVLFVLISLAFFALFCAVVGFKFKAISTYLSARHTRSDFQMSSLSVSSPFVALYKRELRRYFSSSVYVLNTAIGMVLLLLAGVASLFSNPSEILNMLEIEGLPVDLTWVVPMFISLMVGMSCTTASSISLEGKNLWIAKSLPVRPVTIFMSKIAVNLTITLPGILIGGTLLVVSFQASFLQALFFFITPIVYAFFVSMVGLIANLFMPNFSWQNEVTVIKQSAATLIAMLVGMFLAVLPTVLFFTVTAFGPAELLTILSLLFIIIDMGLGIFLKQNGERMFRAL